MKKLVALICIIAAVITGTIPSYAGTPDIRLFFDGKTYKVQNITSHYDEYFLYAEELAEETGVQYEVSLPDSSIKLEYRGTEFTSGIKVFNGWGEIPEKYSYDTPVIINGRLLIPFSYMRKILGMVVEYYKDSGIIYILPTVRSGIPALSSFTNLTYDYSISVTDGIYLNTQSPGKEFNDEIVSLADKYNLFSAEIKCDRLDVNTLEAMRQYLNDRNISDDDLFRRFIGYWKDYFNIKQDYYKKGFIYGKQDENNRETNMRVFNEYDETIFGQNSHIILYNTLIANKQSSLEETHIDISIPVFPNKTIYSINFTLNKNNVNEMTFDRMSSLFNSLQIMELPAQTEPVKVFKDQDVLNAANYGIYGESEKKQNAYIEYVNKSAGYKTVLPSSYTSYIQNSIVELFDYKSFKIDSNSTFSISAEPAFLGDASIQEKIKQIMYSNYGKMENINDNQINLPGKDIRIIQYEIRQSGSDSIYVQNYFIYKNSKLYNIQLTGSYSEPSQIIQNEIRRIALVFDFLPTAAVVKDGKENFIKFSNTSEGYSFLYPKDWQLSQDIVDMYGYITLSFTNPDLTRSVDIFVNEGELYSNFDYSEISNFLAPLDQVSQNSYFKHYKTPYAGKKSKTLLYSYRLKNDLTSHIYKLINYLDDDDKNRLCYSLDIIRGNKIYSFFITIGEYATVDGKFFDKDISRLISEISESFRLD